MQRKCTRRKGEEDVDTKGSYQGIGRRIITAFLAMLVLFAGPLVATARAEEEQTQDQKEAEKANSLAIPVDTNSVEGWPQATGVYADSAIVMDMDSKAILYGKRIDVQHYPASITKLLTTLVALENAKLTDEISFSQDSVSFLEAGDASVGMQPGEVISLDDALHAVLLASANEVSYAVAENVGNKMGGGYDAFIQEMNDRSSELGCKNSHWVNANGLHDDAHYTSAYDMALIGAAVYQRQEFRDIMNSREYVIQPTNMHNESRELWQNHKMLYPSSQYYYAACTGGKTGYTDQARTTLVTFAEQDGLRLVCVNLRSYGAVVYTDTATMFDYAFSNFQKVSLQGQFDAGKVEKSLTENPYVLIPKGGDVARLKAEYSLTEGGKKRQATVSYSYGGQPVGSAEVILKSSYFKELKKSSDPTVKAVKNEGAQGKSKTLSDAGTKMSKWTYGIIFVVALLLLVLLFYLLNRHLQRRHRRKRGARRRTNFKRNRRRGS